MTRVRWAAEGPLVALAAIGAGLALGLLAMAARQVPMAQAYAACRQLGHAVVAWRVAEAAVVPLGVLCVGLVSAALALVHQVWATRRMLARTLRRRTEPGARLARLGRRAGLDGRLDRVEASAAFTFCYGLWRPRVCVSAGLADMLDDDELVAVLRHEAHHLRHRDPLKILLGRSLASGLFFLPLAGALRNGYLGAKELYADADASAAGDGLPLARALCKLLRSERPPWPAGVLAVGAISATNARLLHLIEPRAIRADRPTAGQWAVSAAIVSTIFGLGGRAVGAQPLPPIEPVCSPPAAVAPAPPSGGPAAPEAAPGAACERRCEPFDVPAD